MALSKKKKKTETLSIAGAHFQAFILSRRLPCTLTLFPLLSSLHLHLRLSLSLSSLTLHVEVSKKKEHFAFNFLLVHRILQFTMLVMFRCFLQRCSSRLRPRRCLTVLHPLTFVLDQWKTSPIELFLVKRMPEIQISVEICWDVCVVWCSSVEGTRGVCVCVSCLFVCLFVRCSLVHCRLSLLWLCGRVVGWLWWWWWCCVSNARSLHQDLSWRCPCQA